jgi:hypothetical protein
MVYTFNLRKGVAFHNGAAFDATVAKWNLERAARPENGNPHPEYFSGIETIQTPDSHTLVIRLKSVDALFIAHMAEGDAVMRPMQGYETAKSNPIGTGPYQIRQMGQGRPGGNGPLRRLLESLFAVSGPGGVSFHQRSGRPDRRPQGRRHRRDRLLSPHPSRP